MYRQCHGRVEVDGTGGDESGQGRCGCKSAYETYKRFARTNTRPRSRGLGRPSREEEGGKASEPRRLVPMDSNEDKYL